MRGIARGLILAWLLSPLWLLGWSQNPAWGQKETITVEKVEYKGWKNNLRLSNNEVELIVTLDVGPRIISYRLKDGENVFKEYKDQIGSTGEKSWMIRGGHRLWTAPEDTTRTYFPDNQPVTFKELGPGKVLFSPPPEKKYGIQKEIEIHFPKKGSKVQVVHRITNIGRKPTELAPWALSVMAPGGMEIIPLPEKRPHPGGPDQAKNAQAYWPDFHIVFWPYFDFHDKRCHLGTKYITLKQSRKAMGPIKFGLLHMLDWVAYLNNRTLFVKRIPYEEGKTYPDRNCNFETFTNPDMLEIESLGPVTQLASGESVELSESWELIGNLKIDSLRTHDEEQIDQVILPRIMGKN